MKNARLTRLLALLRLLTPANFAHSFSYLRKYGVRLCFARTVFMLCLALGLRRSTVPLVDRSPAHKARDNRGPLGRKMPDGSPPLDGCQDTLRLELEAIKDELMDSLRHKGKINA